MLTVIGKKKSHNSCEDRRKEGHEGDDKRGNKYMSLRMRRTNKWVNPLETEEQRKRGMRTEEERNVV